MSTINIDSGSDSSFTCDEQFDFMLKVNEFCSNCRFRVEFRCSNMASDFHNSKHLKPVDLRDDTIDFSTCGSKYSEDDLENMRNSDEYTGGLV